MTNENIQTDKPNPNQAIPLRQAWGTHTQTNKWATVAQQPTLQDDVVMADDKDNTNKSTNLVKPLNSSASAIYSYLKIPNPNRTLEEALKDPNSEEYKQSVEESISANVIMEMIKQVLAEVNMILFQAAEKKKLEILEDKMNQRSSSEETQATSPQDQMREEQLRQEQLRQAEEQRRKEQEQRLVNMLKSHCNDLKRYKHEIQQIEKERIAQHEAIYRRQEAIIKVLVDDTLARYGLTDDDEARQIFTDFFRKEADNQPEVLRQISKEVIRDYEAANGRPFEITEGNAQMLREATRERYTNHVKRELTELRRENGEQLLIGAKVTDEPIRETAKKFNRTAVVYTKEKAKHKVVDSMAEEKIEIKKQKAQDKIHHIVSINENLVDMGHHSQRLNLKSLTEAHQIETTKDTAVVADEVVEESEFTADTTDVIVEESEFNADTTDVVVEETKKTAESEAQQVDTVSVEKAQLKSGFQEVEVSKDQLEELADENAESLDDFLDDLDEFNDLDEFDDLDDEGFLNSLDDAAALDSDNALTDIDELTLGDTTTLSATPTSDDDISSATIEEEDISTYTPRGPSI